MARYILQIRSSNTPLESFSTTQPKVALNKLAEYLVNAGVKTYGITSESVDKGISGTQIDTMVIKTETDVYTVTLETRIHEYHSINYVKTKNGIKTFLISLVITFILSITLALLIITGLLNVIS